MKEYELRTNIGNVECRKTEDGEVYIDGRGIVFNEVSEDLGGFQERILPEAVAGLDWSDVYSFINHNPNVVMGRTKSKTMTIEVKADGVHYTVRPPKSAGRYVENIQRGDIDGSSFMFRIADGGDSWEERDGQVPLRTITKFEKVKEMGAVVGPAYPQANADVAVRSMKEWLQEKKPSLEPEVEMDDATRMKGDLLKMREKDNVLN